MLRTAAERHDLSAFSEKAKAIAAKHKAASGELPEGCASGKDRRSGSPRGGQGFFLQRRRPARIG